MRSLISVFVRFLRAPGAAGQVLRFSIAGALGFVVDATILKSLVALGASPTVGRLFSIAAAVTFTWLMNRTLTFAAGRPPSWGEYARYVANSLVGMVINYAVYWLALFVHVPLLIALAIGTVAGAVFNFLGYRVLLSDKRALETPSA